MLTIRSAGSDEYRALYHTHMKRDFPSNELPPYFAVRGNLESGAYDGLFFEDGGEAVGYAVVTAPEGSPFALINFLAIFPQVRSRGYGGKVLACLLARYPGRTLLLEVEDPAFAKGEADKALRTRRIGFYERAGYRVLPTRRAKIFGVPMLIMAGGGEVGSVREAMHALYRPAFSSGRWLKFIDVEDA